jgi:hypothetical protein
MNESETTPTPPAPAANDAYQPEVWIYIGRGIDSDGTVTHRWLDTHNHPRLFSKVGRSCVIGGRYELPVKHTDATTASVLADRMTYLGLAEPERVKTWHAQDAAARVEAERKRLEKKDGKPRLPSLTLTELADEYKRALPTRKAALLAEVIRIVVSGTAR